MLIAVWHHDDVFRGWPSVSPLLGHLGAKEDRLVQTQPPKRGVERGDLRRPRRRSLGVRGGVSVNHKIFCVYIADDEATIGEHAASGPFPCLAPTASAQRRTPTTADLMA
jgi:hypothetical protein